MFYPTISNTEKDFRNYLKDLDVKFNTQVPLGPHYHLDFLIISPKKCIIEVDENYHLNYQRGLKDILRDSWIYKRKNLSTFRISSDLVSESVVKSFIEELERKENNFQEDYNFNFIKLEERGRLLEIPVARCFWKEFYFFRPREFWTYHSSGPYIISPNLNLYYLGKEGYYKPFLDCKGNVFSLLQSSIPSLSTLVNQIPKVNVFQTFFGEDLTRSTAKSLPRGISPQEMEKALQVFQKI